MNDQPPFDLDPDGNIILCPLIGYTTAPAAGMCIIARLEFADSDSHYKEIILGSRAPIAVQLTITPAQALELADRLRKLASHILSQEPPSGQQLN